MILMYSYSKETNWVTNVLVSENKLKVGQIVTVSCQFELATPSVDIAVANAHRSLIDTVIIREGQMDVCPTTKSPVYFSHIPSPQKSVYRLVKIKYAAPNCVIAIVQGRVGRTNQKP